VHSRLSVSAISTYRWSLARDLEFYASAGIDQVGVSLAKLDAHGLEDGVRRVRDSGVRVTNMLGLGPFRLAEPGQWPAQRERLCLALDAARTMGAECLVITSGPAGGLEWDVAADALASALEPVLLEARRLGVPLALEHTNSLRVDVSFVHTLSDAVDLAQRLGVGVCLECNACWGERGLGATISRSVDCIRLVQVSDFVVGTLTTPDRAVPGDGDIPLEHLVAQLLDAGYQGVFDLELIGPRIEAEGYEPAIRRGLAALEKLLS
jgi:sugar phosphate isomerase/epimerase